MNLKQLMALAEVGYRHVYHGHSQDAMVPLNGVLLMLHAQGARWVIESFVKRYQPAQAGFELLINVEHNEDPIVYNLHEDDVDLIVTVYHLQG